jgi:hypothetical protein
MGDTCFLRGSAISDSSLKRVVASTMHRQQRYGLDSGREKEMGTSTRSLGQAVWHATVLVPAILALLCGLWAYALRPPSIPEAFGSVLWIKTDPPSPVNLTLKVGEFEDFSYPFFGFTLPGGSPRRIPHKITMTVELGGMKPGTHWTVVTCDDDISVGKGIATRAPEKSDFPEAEVEFGDMPCGTGGRALVGTIPDNGASNMSKGSSRMIALAEFKYRLPTIAAWDPPYLTIATPLVQFYTHWEWTERERDAWSKSRIRETFSLEPNSVSDYIPYIGPPVVQSDGTWTWDVAPYPDYSPNVTALDLKQERTTQRDAFYSGVLFGVAVSALIQALSQTLARRTSTQ